jgi:hypothetical protein
MSETCERCETKRKLLRILSVSRAAIALCWECEVFELLRLATSEVERLRAELAMSQPVMAPTASREIALLRRVAELASVPELWSTWAANPERDLAAALDELAQHDAEMTKGEG